MFLGKVAHAAEDGLSIHLAPDAVGTLFGVPITNTLLSVWLTMAILALLAIFLNRGLKEVPGKLQNFFELVIGAVFDYMSDVLESRTLAKRFFPLVMTIFLFILFMNWVGLLPFVDAVGVYKDEASHHTGEVQEGSAEIIDELHSENESVGLVEDHSEHNEAAKRLVPFFHPPATDLNITIAFALVAFVAIELAGVTLLGFFKYAGKFINFKSPLGFAIGIIELLSEIARLISFSFRLFGNIFAGKTLLMVVMFLATPYLLPVPLLAYELFVGFIQAFIFAILTLFFIKLAIEEPH